MFLVVGFSSHSFTQPLRDDAQNCFHLLSLPCFFVFNTLVGWSSLKEMLWNMTERKQKIRPTCLCIVKPQRICTSTKLEIFFCFFFLRFLTIISWSRHLHIANQPLSSVPLNSRVQKIKPNRWKRKKKKKGTRCFIHMNDIAGALYGSHPIKWATLSSEYHTPPPPTHPTSYTVGCTTHSLKIA